MPGMTGSRRAPTGTTASAAVCRTAFCSPSVFDGTWNSANGRAINYWWGMRSGAEQISYSAGQNSGTMQLLRLVEKQIAKDDVQVFPSEEYAQGHRKQGAATGIYTPQELMKMDWLDECVEGEMPRYEALDVKSRFLLGVNGLDRYKDEPR